MLETLSTNNEISRIITPYINNLPSRKPRKTICEEYRFVSEANRYSDNYIIESGYVVNNDDIEIIQISSSTIGSVKQTIYSKYNEIDDIRTYIISGNIAES